MQNTTATYRTTAMRATPYPNRLLEHSATLPETQLRILNLVVRSTLGWHGGAPGERRATTTLTVRQIRQRVGRNSALPVVEALAALSSAGILDVIGDDGYAVDFGDLRRSQARVLRVGVSRHWVEEAAA